MNEIDRLALDGYALRLFLTVLETGSVTEAAARLELTQSAVSHGLSRLARQIGTPLFVKSGRGIAPTARALALREPARALMQALQEFGAAPVFEPASAEIDVTIAANDLQRDLLLPGLQQAIARQVKRATLRVIPSQVPSAEILRDGGCDLLITPYPPLGTDILQRRLFRDRYVCFHDPRARPAPASADDYLTARHITVVYPNGNRLDFDRRLLEAGIQRDIAVAVPGFSAIPAFLRGTDMLATMPALFARRLMRDFARSDAALTQIGAGHAVELTMYMAWHRRVTEDSRHRWLRGLLLKVMREQAGIARLDSTEA